MAKFKKGDKIRRNSMDGNPRELKIGDIVTVLSIDQYDNVELEEYGTGKEWNGTYFDLVHPSELVPGEVLIFN